MARFKSRRQQRAVMARFRRGIPPPRRWGRSHPPTRAGDEKVTFYWDPKTKSVDAVFPEIEASPGMVTAYTHIGGHGGADQGVMSRFFRRVTATEAKFLDPDTMRDVEEKYGKIRVEGMEPRPSKQVLEELRRMSR